MILKESLEGGGSTGLLLHAKEKMEDLLVPARITPQSTREQLIALGQNVGPVTPSTRAIHLKKLRNLLAQGDGSVIEHIPIPTITNGNGVHLDIVNGEPTIEVERSLNHDLASNVILESFHAPEAPQPRSERPPAVDDGSDGEMRGEESVRYLSPEEMELEMSYSRRNCSFVGCSSNGTGSVRVLSIGSPAPSDY
ncbi:unnamed protein product [Angiostrongylus costaricensis]|uniref:LEM domain-containing protein n=1 Tax=Angiostrongylus costaricensis TaxID=334426 RepID=A0A158PGQ1_ANGCS|nr:unnamed protein product [Angiostrongylus costaricensis]